MTTPTMEIKQDFERELAEIRNHPDYSQDAKRRYIAEAYAKAQAEHRRATETREQGIKERVEQTEKAVFAPPYPTHASDVEKAQIRALRRGAYEGVYSSVFSKASGATEDPQHANKELERLLDRAERTQDPELADAVYHVATEQGIRGPADAYLEKRPEAKRRWEEYVEARTEEESAERRLLQAMSSGLMRPPELEDYPAAG